MTKFCPNCGNQMSDNAKFCMDCGAKLGDYTSDGTGIKDNVIQRSQVGAASVGKVEISPRISATATAAGGYACRICGSPAATKCSHCKTYICGKCLNKVYYINEYDRETKTAEQIKSMSPLFFCKECFETPRIQYKNTGVFKKWGYLTENELRDGEACENCNKLSSVLKRCEICGKIFCPSCIKKIHTRISRFIAYEEEICPFCKKVYSRRDI